MFKNLLSEGDLGRVVDCKCIFAPLCLLCKDAVAEEPWPRRKAAESWRAERQPALPAKPISQKSLHRHSGAVKIPFCWNQLSLRGLGWGAFLVSCECNRNFEKPHPYLFVILSTPLGSYLSHNGTHALTKLAPSRRLMLWTFRGGNYSTWGINRLPKWSR